MTAYRWFRVGSCTLALALGSARIAPVGALAQTDDQVRTLIARQINADMAVAGAAGPAPVPAGLIQLVSGPSASNVRTWVGTGPTDHGPTYIVAGLDGEAVGLGGFQSPGVQRIAEVLWPATESEEGIRRMASAIALLLDPYGARRTYLAPSEAPPSLLATWSRRAPTNWPNELVTARSDAGWSVRLSVLTQETRSYEMLWRAIAYAFEFDTTGQLVGYSHRVSESFAGP